MCLELLAGALLKCSEVANDLRSVCCLGVEKMQSEQERNGSTLSAEARRVRVWQKRSVSR